VVDVAASPKLQRYDEAPEVVFVNAKLLPLKHWLLLLMVYPDVGSGLTVIENNVLSFNKEGLVYTTFNVENRQRSR